MRLHACLAVLLCLTSCKANPAQPVADPAMFAPVAVRIHPIFTEIKDWTDDGRPDGIEALVELTDQFGDPVKSGGQVLFELYTFRRQFPDPRGNRIASWVMPLHTLKQQREHWRKIGGAYAFQLALPRITEYPSALLTVEFTLDSGGRLRDEIVVSARR
jgi:hypothetical protein